MIAFSVPFPSGKGQWEWYSSFWKLCVQILSAYAPLDLIRSRLFPYFPQGNFIYIPSIIIMTCPFNHNSNVPLRRPLHSYGNLPFILCSNDVRRRTANSTTLIRIIPGRSRRKTRVIGVYRTVDALGQFCLVFRISPVFANMITAVRDIERISGIACGGCGCRLNEGTVDRSVEGFPFVDGRPGSIHRRRLALAMREGNANQK